VVGRTADDLAADGEQYMGVAVSRCSEYTAFTPACGSGATLESCGPSLSVGQVVLREKRSIR